MLDHRWMLGFVRQRRGFKRSARTRNQIAIYATPILHASEAATAPTSRRVLQVDFAAEALPHGLEWLGI